MGGGDGTGMPKRRCRNALACYDQPLLRLLGFAWKSDGKREELFTVIRSRDLWWVDCEGKAYGPFENVADARLNAIRFAEVFADPTRQSQVFALDESGRLHMIWSSGT